MLNTQGIEHFFSFCICYAAVHKAQQHMNDKSVCGVVSTVGAPIVASALKLAVCGGRPVFAGCKLTVGSYVDVEGLALCIGHLNNACANLLNACLVVVVNAVDLNNAVSIHGRIDNHLTVLIELVHTCSKETVSIGYPFSSHQL